MAELVNLDYFPEPGFPPLYHAIGKKSEHPGSIFAFNYSRAKGKFIYFSHEI